LHSYNINLDVYDIDVVNYINLNQINIL